MDFQPISRGVAHSADRTGGLTLFFRDVYAWMAGAVAISGLVAYVVAHSPDLLRLLHGNFMVSVAVTFVAPFAIALYFQRNAMQMSTFAAANLFFTYATVLGASLSLYVLLYTGTSVGRAFFVSSACFGGAAAFGTVTRRELSQWTQFLQVGMSGLLVALFANLYFRSSAVEWVVSMGMVTLFAGLTAYEHQRLKDLYLYQGAVGNVALVGAFSLYLNFINLFIAIIRLTGTRRDD